MNFFFIQHSTPGYSSLSFFLSHTHTSQWITMELIRKAFVHPLIGTCHWENHIDSRWQDLPLSPVWDKTEQELHRTTSSVFDGTRADVHRRGPSPSQVLWRTISDKGSCKVTYPNHSILHSLRVANRSSWCPPSVTTVFHTVTGFMLSVWDLDQSPQALAVQCPDSPPRINEKVKCRLHLLGRWSHLFISHKLLPVGHCETVSGPMAMS